MTRRQRLAVLGSTGSIGVNTLDVVARHPDRFEVVALTAATQVDTMLAQCVQFEPRVAVMASAPHAAELAGKLKARGLATQVAQGAAALAVIAADAAVDTCLLYTSDAADE